MALGKALDLAGPNLPKDVLYEQITACINKSSDDTHCSPNTSGVAFQNVIRDKQYMLNGAKSLEKKLEASLRNSPIEVENTGGGIVITCNAGTYENLKQSVIKYYQSYKSY